MADRTHSHDTPTPAMSAETVPSEEFVLVPREPTPAMLRDGVYAWTMPWADVIPQDIDEDRFILAAIYRAMIDSAPAPNPSPAAKGGDAVREALDLLNPEHKSGPPQPLMHPNAEWCETYQRWFGRALRHTMKTQHVALSTPTEGPDTAVEERDALLKALGFLPGPFKDELSRKVILDDVAGLRPAMVKAREAQSEAEFAAARDQVELAEIRAELLAGQGDDDGLQILPDFKEGQTVLQMVCECIALLETRRDIVEAITPTEGPASQTGPDVEPGQGSWAKRRAQIEASQTEGMGGDAS